MIFKKFYSFKIDQENFSEVLDNILAKMDEFEFEEDPIGNRIKNLGWVKVNSEHETLHSSGSTSTYLSLLIATKKVPKDKLNRKLDERLNEMRESSGGEDPSKKEIKEIKLALEEELIVDEEPKYKKITAAIDITAGRIDVESGVKDAEEVVSFMRSTIGGSGIKVTPYFSDIPMTIYKDWLLHSAPGNIEMGNDHALTEKGAGTTVTYKKVDANNELMLEHLSSGFEVAKTSLIVESMFSAGVNAKGEVAGFKIEDMGQEKIELEIGDVDDGYFEAMMDLMSNARTQFLTEIRGAAGK